MVQRIDVGARMSEAAIHNGTVYLAGQIAEVPGQDIEGQTRQVLTAIDTLLAEHAELAGREGSRPQGGQGEGVRRAHRSAPGRGRR